MLKKAFLILLSLLLILTVAACKKDDTPDDGGGSVNNTTPTTPTLPEGMEKPATVCDSGELDGTDIFWEIYSDETMYVKCKGEHDQDTPCAMPDFDRQGTTPGGVPLTDQPWWRCGGKTSTDRAEDEGGSCTVKKLVIGGGITALGDYAFAYMAILEEVVLPESLTEISYKCFEDCPKLKTVSGGFGVTLIESEAFLSCESLATVELSAMLAEVQDKAFDDVITTGSQRKLTLRIKGTAESWSAAMETLRNTQNADGFACLGADNKAFEEADLVYLP